MNGASPAFDPLRHRADFPILSQTAHGHALVYLDNGATTQKPQVVIDALSRYYTHDNANIHRGVYELSQRATEQYEAARQTVARFLNVQDDRQILFTRGTTESINLVAASWGGSNLHSGDEIVISAMEHHSNIVPWQMLAQRTGATLRVIPINDAGELQLDVYRKLLASGRVRIVAVTHLSNALGTINNVTLMARLAHEAGALILVDGAQWVAHHPTDIPAIDCDFYAFSGHKLFGPTGIGVLYGRRSLLESMPPFMGGGDMIESVTFDKTVYAGLPNKFEAGTPHIAGAVGLAAAIGYVQSIGFDSFMDHERDLLAYATKKLLSIPGLRIVGTAANKGSLISFVLESPAVSSLDIGSQLDRDGIAIRTGHHCCQPVMDRMCIASTARASFALYNTLSDVDALAASLMKVVQGAAARQPVAPATQPSGSGASDGAVAYPKAAAPTVQEAADELAETLDFLGDRDERNQFLLDLAAKLPHNFDLLKQVTPRVPGCMSQVYLVARPVPDAPGRLEFVADADAEIVRGLIAVLQQLYSGQAAGAVLKFDIESFFRRIGLDSFISSQRRSGLSGMIARIRAAAQVIVGSQE